MSLKPVPSSEIVQEPNALPEKVQNLVKLPEKVNILVILPEKNLNSERRYVRKPSIYSTDTGRSVDKDNYVAATVAVSDTRYFI